MIKRHLDDNYFAVVREQNCEYVCFSDLDVDEMESVMENMDVYRLKTLCISLGLQIRELGDQFNLSCEREA